MHKHCVPCFWTNSTAKPRGSAFSLLVFHFVGLFKYAENVKMSYKGVKLNPFEVLITGWRCFVWFLKPFQLVFFFFFLRLWTYTENRRAMWTFATWQHILSVNQTFLTSLSYKTENKKRTKERREILKRKRKREKDFKNTQTFTTWQFSLQTQ